MGVFDSDSETVQSSGYHIDASQHEVGRDSIFDIASITKSIAPAWIARGLVESSQLSLDTPVVNILPELRAAREYDLRVVHLLSFTALFDVTLSALKDRPASEIIDEVWDASLHEPPGGKAFPLNATSIVLTRLVEKVLGVSLVDACERYVPKADESETFTFFPRKISNWQQRVVPTEQDPWRGKTIQAEVHDESAWKLQQEGRIEGSAGLFATVDDLILLGRRVLCDDAQWRNLRLLLPDLFHTDGPVALGWECNKAWMAFGENTAKKGSVHRLGKTGYTGCAMVMDRNLDRGLVLLSNRLWPQRDERRLQAFAKWRRELCSLVFDA